MRYRKLRRYRTGSASSRQRLFEARPSVFSPASTSAGRCTRNSAPAALGEHLEIAARLRRLDDAEGVGLPGHRQDPRRRRR